MLIAGSLAIALSAGCAGEESPCDGLQGMLETCYPELSESMECTPEMLDWYEAVDGDNASCSDFADAGKFDFWGNDGSINWPDGGKGVPSESDWDIVGIVLNFQWQFPGDAQEEVYSWSNEVLLESARSVLWEQQVDDFRGLGPRDMVVEFTQGIVPVTLDTFLERMPAHEWGPNLDHYVNGEVSAPYATDELGRPTRQIERMVLNQVPFDADALSLPAINGDMTKVEVITYEEGLVTVYWRVMYSANGTTESDIGSVSFSRVRVGAEEQTLITFYSAHRLSFFGIHVPNFLLQAPVVGLGAFFEDHIDHYRELMVD